MPTSKFLPTEVHRGGLTALIQNLGRDCHPTQFLREFAKNALEACIRTGDQDCQVVVDYNQTIYSSKGIHKICFVDTGDGMTETQMINLLNNLSASGEIKNAHANYGVGAKISAMTRNHCGIFYESWRDGIGHAVLIKYNTDEGIYGIEGVPASDGVVYAIPLPIESKPVQIKQSGTRVTLFGMDDGQDTMIPPQGIPGIRESWIALYLNSRFFRIPRGVTLSARIGYYRDNNPKHNYLLKVAGQKSILDEKAEIKGEILLEDAKIYWWVMPKGVDGHGRELLKGHTALINEDEIFDISDARSSRIAYFGVVVGRDRVIVYVEPMNVVQNTARTNLLRHDGSPVLWDRWQDQFRTNMPAELKKLLDALQSESQSESHTDTIKDRLKSLKELYKLSRYRVDPTGSYIADPKSGANFGTGHVREGATTIKSTDSQSRGSVSGGMSTELLTQLVQSGPGVRASSVAPDPFPTVQWVKASEGQDGLIDRVAEYIQPQNLILANLEYQGIADLVRYFSKAYIDVPEVIRIIEEEVKIAFEQVLTEGVAGALSLKNRANWNPKDFETAVSREALTTAVMPRYWMVSSIKRNLGNKIKGFVESAS